MKKGKQKIIDAAYEVVLKKGIKEASVRDIAKEAGISLGTFSYHYPNKERLLFDLFEMLVRKQDEALSKGLQSDKMADRKEAIVALLKDATQIVSFMKLSYYLLGEAFAQNEEMHDLMQEKYRRWRTEFRDYLYKESTGNEEAQQLNATLLIAMLDGLSIQLLLEPESMAIEAMAEKVIHILYD